MRDIVINNNLNYKINECCIEMCEIIFDALELDNISMSINFISDEDIRTMNSEFRNKDSATDVISFSVEGLDNSLFEEKELGDIFIALDYVYSNSREIGHSMSREFAFVLCHGILHLLGYTHDNRADENEMFELQETLIVKAIEKGDKINEIFSR